MDCHLCYFQLETISAILSNMKTNRSLVFEPCFFSWSRHSLVTNLWPLLTNLVPRAFSTFQNDKPLFWKSSKRRPWGQNENLFSVLRSVAKSKMSASSLVKLSASAVIQDGCIVDGCDLSTLPRTVLQELLLTSISKSRMLCLRSLITNRPMQHLVLQNVSSFDEPKAVLLAYCLQRTKYDLKLVDMRGCNTGESNFEFL